MQNENFNADLFRAEAQKFVCVRLDGTAHPELVKRYLVIVYPAVVLIPPGGEPYVALNYRTPIELVREMRDALKPREVIPISIERPAAGDEPGNDADRDEPEESPALPPRPAEPSRGDAE
jgi:hypothetical protein